MPLNIGDFACRYRRHKAFRQETGLVLFREDAPEGGCGNASGRLLERSFPKPLPELSTHFIGSANIVPLNFGDFACRYRRHKAFRQVTSNRCGTTHGSFRPNHQLTTYHFYPVAERGVNRPNPAGRDWAREQPEIVARNTATQNPHSLKTESKAPLN